MEDDDFDYPNQKIGEVLFLKMANGDSVMAEVVQIVDNMIDCILPVKIIQGFTSPDRESVTFGFMSYCEFLRESKISLSVSHILGMAVPSEDGLKMYNEYKKAFMKNKSQNEDETLISNKPSLIYTNPNPELVSDTEKKAFIRVLEDLDETDEEPN